ncbi:hypothetical protein [Streptomyces sp. NPDC102360]|uniref:hypothetical protein n=1 Tax=Streptomyces sp. NPDC102360 TaxID=3366160 RepID=UPI00381A7E50
MKVRTQRRVFVGGQSLVLVSGLGQIATSPHLSAWKIAVLAVAGTCMVIGIVLVLRDFRRLERREEAGE